MGEVRVEFLSIGNMGIKIYYTHEKGLYCAEGACREIGGLYILDQSVVKLRDLVLKGIFFAIRHRQSFN